MLRRIAMAALAAGSCGAASLPAGAQGLASCQVGQRVAMKNFRDKWVPAVVVAVDPSKPYPCRVHPLGYTEYQNESWPPSMLRPASAATEPPGALASDPYLRQAQGGRPASRPGRVLPGSYECSALSGGRLSPRMALNFSIADGGRYRDVSGAAGTYRFDPGSGAIAFSGAALDGQRGRYEQPTTPPTRNQPPTVTLDVSHDSCELRL